MPDARDFLAAERTLLAWIRTGIALMAFGFLLARFGLFLHELALITGHAVAPHFDKSTIGAAAIASGVVVNVWAAVRYRALVQRLRSGSSEVSTTGPLVLAVATGVGGLILIAMLVSR